MLPSEVPRDRGQCGMAWRRPFADLLFNSTQLRRRFGSTVVQDVVNMSAVCEPFGCLLGVNYLVFLYRASDGGTFALNDDAVAPCSSAYHVACCNDEEMISLS